MVHQITDFINQLSGSSLAFVSSSNFKGDIPVFYDRFYELCQSMGVTPTQAARDIAVGQSTVSMWKLQGTTPKHDTLRKLAHYFGVSIDYLLNRGPRFDPVFPSRQIIPVMYRKNSSLEDLSQKTSIPIDVLCTFGLGGKAENGRECLEKIADALHANPAYLMGWTVYEDDEMPYLEITEEMWRLSDNDPDAAHGLQQFAEDEEYQRAMDEEERQCTENHPPVLFKVGDSYYGGALRIADVEEKSDSDFSVTFHVDEDGMEAKELISLFEMLQSMSSKHGVSIDGLTQLAKMVQAVAAKEPVQENKPTSQEDDNT